MTQTILTHTYDNGLVLVAEPMSWLESAAFTFLLPAGCANDPADRTGLANFTCDMVQRGCGSRDNRQFVEDLERLGVERSASVGNAHTSYGAAMLADDLDQALPIYADLLRAPRLPASQLEEARLVCLQELHAVEDDLAQQAMLQLRSRSYPDPFGRSSYGELAAVQGISSADVRGFFQAHYRPNNAILSVAGNIDWQRLRDLVGSLLGDWPATEPAGIAEKSKVGGYHHIQHESSQTHIGVAYPSVPYRHQDYYQARGAVGILSDGMSSRLFTEVREKRGLCYSVYASCHSLRDRGSVLCYSGTSTDRAQETLDVLLAELNRLADGIEQDELDRLKARVKSTLIMQQESSPARSISIATDWYHLGRVQTLEEIGQIIDKLSCSSINSYLARNPPGGFTIVTLGQRKLEVPVAVS